ncbi:MAG: M3 family metallopeptidase [Marinilabiliaceae bacterium]|nr:M3 family metallopeptidase [Marinilabiliaceae bacterium]
MNNPLLQPFATLYATPPFHLIETHHYLPAFVAAMDDGRAEIAAIIDNYQSATFANTIEALDKSGWQLSLISNIFFNFNHAHTNDTIQQIAREVSPLLTAYSNDIWLNEALFERVKRVHDADERAVLRADQVKLLNDTYKAFVRKGALLSGDEKERYRKITTELSELSLRFGENLLAETNDYFLHVTDENDLAGLPASLIEQAKADAGARQLDGWVFTLHFPSYVPFMKYAQNRLLREQMFRAYSARGNQGNERDNKQVLSRIVQLRIEKAQLLGFRTYADYVLDDRMAQSVERVTRFLDDLLTASKPFALQDVADVNEFARRDGFTEPVQRWDFTYYSEKLKSERYDINEEALRPYFALDKVEASVFALAGTLFGLSFVENGDIPVYHPDVKAYEVTDEKGNFLSVLYLDYFPRPSKQGGAWMTSFREQVGETRPVVSLVMNFSRPGVNTPSLLTFNEVRTFLHEFGHALHGMLSQVAYVSQSGTSVMRDFVELPSQIMENWGNEKAWLRGVARHYLTGEVLSDEWIDKIVAASNFQSGYATIRQLSFGMLDMAWHSLPVQSDSSVVLFEADALAPTELFPPVDGICISTAFSHIFNGGYAAGYYGYKWAEVLDADAFELFLEKGIFNAEVAASFRTNILEKGGSAHPMDLYRAFRGHEPSIAALLKRSGLTK